MPTTKPENLLVIAAQIRLLIFDVDGVLTDGRLFLDNAGQEYKAFHSRDGHGMKMLQDSGVAIAIITGRVSEVVNHRMHSLGIKHVFQGQQDKLIAYHTLLKQLQLEQVQTAYVGDDIVDLPVMRQVGLAVAVNDAHALVKQYAHWVTPEAGGRGAARSVCELIMSAQKTWEQQLARYLAD